LLMAASSFKLFALSFTPPFRCRKQGEKMFCRKKGESRPLR
jgi:hypothetical protein